MTPSPREELSMTVLITRVRRLVRDINQCHDRMYGRAIR
jgi:hypothetical protein